MPALTQLLVGTNLLHMHGEIDAMGSKEEYVK
jgi:hypothetical protein